MEVLISNEIKRCIESELHKSEESVQIISAFIKQQSMEFLDINLAHNVSEKKILARFRLNDLLAGATDISIYDYCKVHDWKLYIRFDLHAKTYIFDNSRCIIGSANMTGKGMGLNENGNLEMACVDELDEANRKKVDTLFCNAVLIDDRLYALMRNQYENADKIRQESQTWSDEILNLFVPDYNVLFTYDFPEFPSTEAYGKNDIGFLSISADAGISNIRDAFMYSRAFLWLTMSLKNNAGELYFGEAASMLHEALIEEPKPYRKDVKILLSNLLGWIRELNVSSICVDRPHYSERIRLVQS